MYKKVLSVIHDYVSHEKQKLLFATLLRRRLNQCIARFLAKIVVAKLLKLQ